MIQFDTFLMTYYDIFVGHIIYEILIKNWHSYYIPLKNVLAKTKTTDILPVISPPFWHGFFAINSNRCAVKIPFL